MKHHIMLKELMEKQNNYWAERLLSQLQFADAWLKDDEAAQKLLIKEIETAWEKTHSQGVLTKNDCLEAEQRLGVLSAKVRELTVFFAAHAHIDMNWQWGYHETAAVTVDTFRTMLDLMREYPEFKFSQSQASVYKIVEELEPEMLDEIRQRVHEGRWEVTASTWVETDKNMPDGESLVRHIQYTRDYLSRLLDIDPASLDLDFEPDTFGHNENVPEILSRAGIKYYYHCRGYDKEYIYNWEAPSGARVLVYREPYWYNADIKSNAIDYLPEFCRKNGLKTALKVYGVGDHGGGPTRRDVEKIIDMSTWPLMPTIRFGTFHDFFRSLEAERYPVVKQELNFIFTGCYTTQTRIKMANRIAQTRMNETEALTALRQNLDGVQPDHKLLRSAWEKILFNHFHDILPGSCVIESREHALGRFQEAMAAINTQGSVAMRSMAAKMNTLGLISVPDRDSRAEGAGVGFGTGPECGYHFPQTERGSGRERLIHVFNPTQYARREVTECTIWDYQGDLARLIVTDTAGAPVRFEVKAVEKLYWNHSALRLLIEADVESYGYRTYIVRERDSFDFDLDRLKLTLDRFSDDDIVLENEKVRAVFKRETMLITELTDKKHEKVLIDKPSGGFVMATEDPVNGMTAWRVGPFAKIVLLNEQYPVRVEKVEKNELRQSVRYSIEFEGNLLEVELSLDENSTMLDYKTKLRWVSVGTKEKGIPHLRFDLPLSNAPARYLYDEACGVIERPAIEHDVPANSFAAAVCGEQALVLACDCKYGFRGDRRGLGLTLVRSSYDPDPLPENCDHRIRIGVGVCDANAYECVRTAAEFCQPMPFISGTAHAGTLPCDGSGLKVDGCARVSVWKAAEDGCGSILRLYSLSDRTESVKVRVPAGVQAVLPVDLSEKQIGEPLYPTDGQISLQIAKGELLSYRLQ